METARHPNFKKLISSLPKSVQEKAKETYMAWKEGNPNVQAKIVNGCDRNVFSIGFNSDGCAFRVLGIKTKDRESDKERCVWFWIGSHEDYNNYIPSQRNRLKSPENHIINTVPVQNMLNKIRTREDIVDKIQKNHLKKQENTKENKRNKKHGQ